MNAGRVGRSRPSQRAPPEAGASASSTSLSPRTPRQRDGGILRTVQTRGRLDSGWEGKIVTTRIHDCSVVVFAGLGKTVPRYWFETIPPRADGP